MSAVALDPVVLWSLRLALALERYGTLDLPTVLAPAIALARDGFEIGPYHVGMLKRMQQYGLPERFPETGRIQFPPAGTPIELGWRLVQQDLARTLERIAAEGPRVFLYGYAAIMLSLVVLAIALIWRLVVRREAPAVRKGEGSQRLSRKHIESRLQEARAAGVDVSEAQQELQEEEEIGLQPTVGTGEGLVLHLLQLAILHRLLLETLDLGEEGRFHLGVFNTVGELGADFDGTAVLQGVEARVGLTCGELFLFNQ